MDEPFIASLYKSDDERIETDLPPLVYDVWSSAERAAPGDAQWLSIIGHAGKLLNEQPVTAKTRKPFDRTNTVMDIQLDGGGSVFVRVLVWRDEDPEDPVETWKRARLFAEFSILRWLEANASSLPVPRVLAFNDINGLLVTTLMPGLDAAHTYPRLSTAAKEHSVASWAHVSVLMFRLPVPQQFGMIEDPPVQGRLHLSLSPEHTFDTDNTTDLLSFFMSAISTRRTRSLMINNLEEQEMLCRRLDRLLEGLKPLVALAQDTLYMSRFALTHRDPRSDNIILDETSGEVVGIVDWEFNGCVPACMSAEYPSWIRSPIFKSPLYRNAKSKFLAFFNEPRTERNRLSDLYEKTVKELDEDYYNCLLHGTRLCDVLAWIENNYNDHDGFGMERWTEEHLFPTVAEADHRCA
ncbi:hypothetical protein B0H10DRAFT_2006163 [Mycena sp. CBHHK59/15]|nr:hypothetical protein B0H10DRAFT_2006163 [Mycena sp. CBHHK59/15]